MLLSKLPMCPNTPQVLPDLLSRPPCLSHHLCQGAKAWHWENLWNPAPVTARSFPIGQSPGTDLITYFEYYPWGYPLKCMPCFPIFPANCPHLLGLLDRWSGLTLRNAELGHLGWSPGTCICVLFVKYPRWFFFNLWESFAIKRGAGICEYFHPGWKDFMKKKVAKSQKHGFYMNDIS